MREGRNSAGNQELEALLLLQSLSYNGRRRMERISRHTFAPASIHRSRMMSPEKTSANAT